MLEFISMNKAEGVTPNERGKLLYELSQSATRMVVERIIIENLGLDLTNLPLCTEEEADRIESFLPKAKVGFALSLHSNNVLESEIRELLLQTTPLTLRSFHYKVALQEEQNNLPEYRHTLATIAYLLRMRRVAFFNFEEPPKDVDYDLGLQETYWNFNTFSVDHIWTIMEELETLTRAALYQPKNMETGDLLKVGHFFAAGKEIAKVFDL